MKIYRILLVVLCLLIAERVYSEIYQWKDQNGTLHFSDQPPPSEQATDETENSVPNSAPVVNESKYVIAEPRDIKLEIRRLLRLKRFNELNKILSNYQTAFDSDISAEDDLFAAYAAFEINDIAYESLLNDWIETTPDQYQPYLARASFYYRMGWISRGGKWASETKEEQFKKMRAYFTQCTRDLEKSFAINDQCLVAHYMLIGIASATGLDNEVAAVAKKALEIKPVSYKIRSNFMWALTPRWGGTFELMASFAAESQRYVSENPKLKLLKGMAFSEAADLEEDNGRYSVAEELYDKALTFGENHETLVDRGMVRYRRKNYQSALKDLNRAIELYAEIGDYYYQRSRIYGALKQYQNALLDIERADALDPNNDNVQKQRNWLASQFIYEGYNLRKNQQPAKALEQYNYAILLTPDDALLYYRRARAFIDLSDLTMALADLKKSIELDPHDINAYLLIDWVLVRQKDWDQIISYWDQFIALHPENSRAYVERGGAYFHKGDLKSALENAKICADMGNITGKEAYEKLKHGAK